MSEMETRDIVILANSWRHRGHCIAGKDLQTREWIRPINKGEENLPDPFTFSNGALRKLCGNSSGPELLDCYRVFLEEECPTEIQPENWYVHPKTWERLGRLSVADLRKLEDKPSFEWLGSRDIYSKFNGTDRIRHSEIMKKPLKSSLLFINLNKTEHSLEFGQRDYPGRRSQDRVKFSYDSVDYDLAITATHLSDLRRKMDDDEILNNCYMTIGIGSDAYYNDHYKFVVALIPVLSRRIKFNATR